MRAKLIFHYTIEQQSVRTMPKYTRRLWHPEDDGKIYFTSVSNFTLNIDDIELDEAISHFIATVSSKPGILKMSQMTFRRAIQKKSSELLRSLKLRRDAHGGYKLYLRVRLIIIEISRRWRLTAA